MPLSIDPEVGAVLSQLIAITGPDQPFRSIAERRADGSSYHALISSSPDSADVTSTDFYTNAKDGHSLLLRWYTKSDSTPPGSAVYYIHGGGMIVGSVRWYDNIVKNYVSRTGVPFLSVEYRLAPEFPYPVPVEDAYAGLQWLHTHASELGFDSARIAIMGDSAGGGLAATTTLLARERGGPQIAKQILVYPMLEDRNVTADAAVAPFLTWSGDDNKLGWTSYLGEARGGQDVPETAAGGRMVSGEKLPPTYIDVGELDLFRQENVDFASKVANAGVSVEIHQWPGCPHAFELLARDGYWAKEAIKARVRAITTI